VNRYILAFWLVIAIISLNVGAESPNLDKVAVDALAVTEESSKSPTTAEGISLEKPELPNLHRVTDNLYRGAQPTAEGFKELEKMGVKTIINLRGFHSDEDLLKNTHLSYESIRFNTWHPEDEDVIKFLQIVTDKNRYPIFVHCQHGADRTGLMIAIYRMAIQKWAKEDAIKEMTDGNYGFHAIWQNLISYLNDLNVEAIKAAAKIP